MVWVNEYLFVFLDAQSNIVFLDANVIIFGWPLEDNLPRLGFDSDIYPFESHVDRLSDCFKKSKDIFIQLRKLLSTT